MAILQRIQETLTGKSSDESAKDITDALHEEHEEIQSLLEQLVESQKTGERNRLFRQVKLKLVPHARAEEKVVYDPIIGLRDKEAKVDGNEGYLEHGLTDRMIAKLSRLPNKTSPEYTAAAKVLKELIAHHVREEERDIFGLLKDNFSKEERQQMTLKFEASKSGSKSQLEIQAVLLPLANIESLVEQPAIFVVDRFLSAGREIGRVRIVCCGIEALQWYRDPIKRANRLIHVLLQSFEA